MRNDKIRYSLYFPRSTDLYCASKYMLMYINIRIFFYYFSVKEKKKKRSEKKKKNAGIEEKNENVY